MLQWYVRVFMEDGSWNACVSVADTDRMAEYVAVKGYRDDGYEVDFAEAELFNTFEHGDPRDYEIFS